MSCHKQQLYCNLIPGLSLFVVVVEFVSVFDTARKLIKEQNIGRGGQLGTRLVILHVQESILEQDTCTQANSRKLSIIHRYWLWILQMLFSYRAF